MNPTTESACLCGEEDCDYLALGYPQCAACREHHRPWPQCPGLTEDGEFAERPWIE